MRSFRIKKNSGRGCVDIERTEHDFWFHKRRLCRHMIHLSCVGCWLLIAILPLGGLLVGLLRAIIRHVTFFTTIETLVEGARGASLHRSVVGCSLSWCLLTTLLLRMLVTILLLVLVGLGVLTMIALIGGVLGTSTGSLAEDCCEDEYYFWMPAPEVSSSWPPSLHILSIIMA